MTLSITATPDLTTTPPSVRIELSDPAGAVNSVTVVRTLSDRTNATVRTSDGKVLPLTVSGSARVGTLIDYEAPFGQPITYIANGTAQTGQVTLEVDVPWLISPGSPALSVPIDLRSKSFESRSRATERGVFHVIGRARPIVVTAGARKSSESSITVRTSSANEALRLEALLAFEQVLFLNIPTQLGLGVRADYISVGDVDEVRPSSIGMDPLRHWRLPYLVVDAPLGGSSSGPVVDPGTPGGGTGTPGSRTWASLALANGVWEAAKARHATWAAAAAG